MRVIDLLNKIANGEIEANEKFCYKGEEYRHIDNLFGDYYVEEVLNNEVEIIEEDKKIEKIPVTYQENYTNTELFEYLRCCINEIIDYINKENK